MNLQGSTGIGGGQGDSRPFPHRALRGLSLAETLVAAVLTALVMAAAAGTVSNWSRLVRAMPQTTGHGTEDAQIQQMLAELRGAYQLVYLYTYPAVGAALENCTVSSDTRGTGSWSDSQIAVDAGTSANYAAAPVINGTATNVYQLAYDYSGGALWRADNSGYWYQVTQSAATIAFTAYDASGNGYAWVDTDCASRITSVRVTVEYPGQPVEQELIVFNQTPTYRLQHP